MNEILYYFIIILGGLTAGVINTLSGNGSVITLAILTEIVGLPANVANGTNRIGVLLQSGTSYLGLKRNIPFRIQDNYSVILYILLGAVLGGITASIIDNASFNLVYKTMIFVMLFTIIAKPDRWLKKQDTVSLIKSKPLKIMLYILLGFYGGFIQMGMGILFLAVMVLLDGKAMMSSNILKAFIIFVFTTVVLAIFAYRGLVDWQAGAILALAQAAGGWIGGNYISRSEKANLIAYYVLVTMVSLVALKMVFF